MRIVYLPPIPFSGLKQRPQYIAEELAREHDVIYVDPTISVMKFLMKGGDRPGGYFYQAGDRLKVIRLNGIFSAHRSMEAVWGLLRLPEKVQLKKYLKKADMVWVGYCPWYGLIRGFSGIVVYDKMDDDQGITQNLLMRKLITKMEPALIKQASHIFVTAQQFQEEISAMGKHSVLLPNAVNKPEFEVVPNIRQKNEGRIFGYVGMISHWFDMKAVSAILDADPRNQVILVGPSEISLPMHERLIWTGHVPKEEVAGWIASFDVCLYPFKRTSFLDSIDPVKIYEYLAMNKPVLAVRSRETEKFGGLLNLYSDYDELGGIVTEIPAKPFDTEDARKKYVVCNSWEERLKIVNRELMRV